MSEYPVAYDQQPSEQRNRLTVFFRYFMIIPHSLWAFVYGIAVYFAVVIAWFAIVITGRWPAGLYDFTAGFLRFYGRLSAYSLLVTDRYPPFDGGPHPEYPVQIEVAPRQESYSRAKAFFRIILAIPILVVAYVMSLWATAVAIAMWFVAVITGRTSSGLIEAVRVPIAYTVRAYAYMGLLTEDWPPFDPGPTRLGGSVERASLTGSPESPR